MTSRLLKGMKEKSGGKRKDRLSDRPCMLLKAADRGIFSADRAVRTFFQTHLSEIHCCGIKGQQGIGEQGSGTGDEFQHFRSLNRAQHSGDRTQHPGSRAPDRVRRRLSERAAITGGLPRKYGGRLTVKAENTAVGKGDTGQDTGIVHKKFGCEIIRPLIKSINLIVL